jgi:uroporphyrinogen-III synthase
VGEATSRALVAAGVSVPPVVGEGDGAEVLWAALVDLVSWAGVRVLVPTTPGGRTDLAVHLRAAGALVTTVDAYRMVPRPQADIVEDWTRAVPEAVVVASARAAETLCNAIGSDALRAVSVVAIGASTAGALERLGVSPTRPARAGFGDVARLLAAQQAMERSA